jgi:hypothetical protein
MNDLPISFITGIKAKLVNDEFPRSARQGLLYIIKDLEGSGCIKGSWDSVRNELLRTARAQFPVSDNDSVLHNCVEMFLTLEWYKLVIFCERFYSNLLVDGGETPDQAEMEDPIVDGAVAREKFSKELNYLLREENIPYEFADGKFRRHGPQNIKVRLGSAKKRVQAEASASVRETVSALEACVEVLTGKPVDSEFAKEIRRFKRNDDVEILSPIVDRLVDIFIRRRNGDLAFDGDFENLDNITSDNDEKKEVADLISSYREYLAGFFKKDKDKQQQQ